MKESKPAKPTVSSEEDLSSIVTKGSNIQANKQMKDLQKLNKKKRKRASMFCIVFTNASNNEIYEMPYTTCILLIHTNKYRAKLGDS